MRSSAANGSEAFINWGDNTLQIRQTPNVMWDSRDPFEFRIVDSVQELEQLIRRRHADGFTARLAAGFCRVLLELVGPDTGRPACPGRQGR